MAQTPSLAARSLAAVIGATAPLRRPAVRAPSSLPGRFMKFSIRVAFGCVGPVLLYAAAQATGQELRFDTVHQMLPSGADASDVVLLEDLDGDGDLDAFILRSSGFSARDGYFLNDGLGRFSEAPNGSLPRRSAAPGAACAGDVDGDGDIDLALGDGLFLNDGAGRFTEAGASSLPATWGGRAVVLGDVDGDGDLDALFGRYGGRNGLFLGDGTGRFVDVSAAALPTDSDRTLSIGLGDVDGDGDLDGVLVGERPGLDRLYLNDGSGVFADATANVPQVSVDSLGVALGDVDGDGDLDLVVGRDNESALLVNDGFGLFVDVAPAQLPSTIHARNLASIELVDLDADGDLDIAATGALLRNDGAGSFDDVTVANRPSFSLKSSATGDLDADGDLDWFAGRGVFATVGGSVFPEDSLLLNRGDGSFVDVSRGDLPKESAFSTDREPRAAFGDIDGDGDLDLVVGSNDFGRVFVNDGTGVFDRALQALSPPAGFLANIEDLVLAELDGDGDLDIVFVGSPGGSVYFLNDGLGHFTPAPVRALPLWAGTGRVVEASDVDGDGDLDLVVGYDGLDALFLNLGAGRFRDASASFLPAVGGMTSALAFDDINGDGNQDLFVAHVGGPTGVYLGDGTGRFVDATAASLPIAPAGIGSLATRDFDSDGDVDVLMGEPMGRLRYFRNDGSGTFAEASLSHLPDAPFAVTGLAVGDVDGDGHPDIAVGDETADRLLLNDGAGSFEVAPRAALRGVPSPTRDVVLVDLDGDADLDLYVAKHVHQGQVYRNLARQLVARHTPRVGKPLWLDLFGAPGATYALYGASFGPGGSAVLGPWRVFAVGSTDVEGHAAVTLDVPARPALVGLSYVLRARLGDGATNLERVVLMAL